MSYTTLEVVKNIMDNHNLRYTTVIEGKVKTAYYNKNGGISLDDNTTMVMGGKMLTTMWELILPEYTFMEAINSNKKIKHRSWEKFKPVHEALFDLLDFQRDVVIDLINGKWNIQS